MSQQNLNFGTAAPNDGDLLPAAFLKIQQNFDDLYGRMAGSVPFSLKIAPDQSLSISPTGNSTTTLSSLSIQGTTASATTREFLFDLGLISNKGSGVGTPGGDKVGMYAGAIGQSGTGGIWAANFLARMESGSGSYDVHGIEVDIDNFNAHLGDADGGGGLSPPSAYGFSVSGASTFRITAGIGIFSANKMFNRGILFALDCIVGSTYQDLTNSVTSLDVRGTHDYGLDLRNGTFNQAPIRLPNNTLIKWRNAAGNGDVSALKLNASDTIELGANVGIGGSPSDVFHAMASQSAGTAKARIHNTSNANNTTKLAAFAGYGTDTVNTVKEVVRLEIVPEDSNWVGGTLKLYTRTSDAVTEAFRINGVGFSQFLGSLGRASPVTKTADFTLAATENWIINNKAGSACVVTLPAASSFPGREVMFKTIQALAINSNASNVVPRAGGAANTPIVANVAGNWATIVSDGTNWILMQGTP